MDYRYDDFLPEGSLEDFRKNFAATLQEALKGDVSEAAKAALNRFRSDVENNNFDLAAYVVANAVVKDLDIDTRTENLQGNDVTDVPTDIFNAFLEAITRTEQQLSHQKNPAHISNGSFSLNPADSHIMDIRPKHSTDKGGVS